MSLGRSIAWLACAALVVVVAACDSASPTDADDGCHIAALTVAPSTPLLESLGERVTLEAKSIASGGSTAQAAVAWTSDAPNVVVLEGTGTSVGARAVGAGTARVTASSCGFSAQATVTVQPSAPVSVSISPASVSLRVADTATVDVRVSGGSVVTPPTLKACTSSNAGVATAIASSGASCRITGVGPGTSMLSATLSTGESATLPITVLAQLPAITALDVQPAALQMGLGDTRQLRPTVSASDARVSTSYAFESSTPAIASVAPDGTVSALAPGDASITVTATGQGTGFGTTTLSTTVPVSVRSAPAAISDLTVAPSTLSLVTGGAGSLRPTVAVAIPTATVIYSFATVNANVARVAPSGVVTAIAPGTTTIVVTAAGTATGFSPTTLTTTVPVRVDPAPVALEALTLNPTGLTLPTGSSAAITATARTAGPGVQVQYDFKSSDARVATVSASGVVTAVAAGSATVSVMATGSGSGYTTSTITATATVVVSSQQGARVDIRSLQMPIGPSGALQQVDGTDVAGRLTVSLNVSTAQSLADTLRISLGTQTIVCQTWAGNVAVIATVACQLNTASFDPTVGAPNAQNGSRALTATIVSHAAGAAGVFDRATDASTITLNNVSGLFVGSTNGVRIATAPSSEQLRNGGPSSGQALAANGVTWRAGGLSVAITPVDFGGAKPLPSSIPVTLFDAAGVGCALSATQAITASSASSGGATTTFIGVSAATPACSSAAPLTGFTSGQAGTQVLVPLAIPVLDANGGVVASSSAGVAPNAPAGSRLAATVFIDNQRPPAPTGLVVPSPFTATGGWIRGLFSFQSDASIPNFGAPNAPGSIAYDYGGVGSVRAGFESIGGAPPVVTAYNDWRAIDLAATAGFGVQSSARATATDALGNRSVLADASTLPFIADGLAPRTSSPLIWSVQNDGTNGDVTLEIPDLIDSESGMATRPFLVTVGRAVSGPASCPDTLGGDIIATSSTTGSCNQRLGRLVQRASGTSGVVTFSGDGVYTVGRITLFDRVGNVGTLPVLTDNSFVIDRVPPLASAVPGYVVPPLTSGAVVALAPFAFSDNLDIAQAYMVADYGGFRIVGKQFLTPHPSGLANPVRTLTPTFDLPVTSTVSAFGGSTLSLRSIGGFVVDQGHNVSNEVALPVPAVTPATVANPFGGATSATLTCDQCSGGSLHTAAVPFGSGLVTSTVATLQLSGPSGAFAQPAAQFYLSGLDNALNAYWTLSAFALKGSADNGTTRSYTYQATFSAVFGTQTFRTRLNGGSARFLAYAKDAGGHYFYVLGQGSVALIP